MSVVCVYAPTVRAVPQSDILVIFGDFNARVGVWKTDEKEWRGKNMV